MILSKQEIKSEIQQLKEVGGKIRFDKNKTLLQTYWVHYERQHSNMLYTYHLGSVHYDNVTQQWVGNYKSTFYTGETRREVSEKLYCLNIIGGRTNNER